LFLRVCTRLVGLRFPLIRSGNSGNQEAQARLWHCPW
jgi:hypothetical protein